MRGAAISALVAGGIEVAEYIALQVKQAVVGNGHAGTKRRFNTWYAAFLTGALSPMPMRWRALSPMHTADKAWVVW